MGVLLFCLYLVNLATAISILFVRKKQVGSTLAWLLIFAFAPFLGFILYFFFGSTMKFKILSHRWRPSERAAEYARGGIAAQQALLSDKLPISGQGREEYQNLVLSNLHGSGAVYTQDNTAVLLTSAQAKYEKMFAEIEEATESIHVLYFILKAKDESGKRFLQLLTRKASQGVKVRLIYDTLGCLRTKPADFLPLERAGGMVYGYLPSRIETLLQINYRMHRKMVVIDGKIAYTGGINIGDDYLGYDKRIKPWRDTSIRLTGSCVRDIQFRFMRDWVYLDSQHKKPYQDKIDAEESLPLYLKEPEETGNAGVQIICSGPDSSYPYTKESYQMMIAHARRYLYIQTPYFVPDETLMATLRCAALSGVDVRVMIPGVPDKPYAYHVTFSHMGELLRCGAKVYLYPGFLHAKTFVMDDLVSSVGTTNFDIRSFDLDFEINAMVYDREFALECRHAFEKDMRGATRLTPELYRARPLKDKIKESLLRLITPLL